MVNRNVFTDAKVSIFSEKDASSAEFFIFHSKRYFSFQISPFTINFRNLLQRYEKSPTFTSRGCRFLKIKLTYTDDVRTKEVIICCKGKHFFRLAKISSHLFREVTKMTSLDGKSHKNGGKLPFLPLWVPENVASRASFSGFLPENSTTPSPETPIKRGVSACAARKTGQIPARAAPTALRPRADLPTCHSGICNDVLPPFVGTARPMVLAVQASQVPSDPDTHRHAHPRSWLTMRHEKAGA